MANTPHFGKAGRLTFRSDEQGAKVALSGGEFLRCRLTATGPGQAVFVFSCQHRPLRNAEGFPGHPQQVYEWRHPAAAGDVDAPSESYTLSLIFLKGIRSYSFLMEKVDGSGAVLATLKDFDASTTEATDQFRSAIALEVS